MDDVDLKYLRAAIEVAEKARQHGNHPFGAVLVDEGGRILLEAENTVVTTRDCTGHAELNLLREASAHHASEFLQKCTLYASTEPCPMCAGAIFWANVGRVVYGLSEAGLYAMVGEESSDVLQLSCREVFERGKKPIVVLGPLIEEEARQVHLGFWD